MLTVLFFIWLVLFTTLIAKSAQAQTFTVLHTFTGGPDGGNPLAGVTIDRAGNLYGTTYYGGSGLLGTVYELKTQNSNWVLNTLHSFTGYPNDGAHPEARVVFGPNGILYGTTEEGGNHGCNPGSGCGTVFTLRPQPTVCGSLTCPWTETLLYAFGGYDPAFPMGDLIFDDAGNIYGTGAGGGTMTGAAFTSCRLPVQRRFFTDSRPRARAGPIQKAG